MTPEWRKAVHAVDVLQRVRCRLVAAGAMAEVSHFDRLSVDELDLLVRQELRADIHKQTSVSPQGRDATVAA